MKESTALLSVAKGEPGEPEPTADRLFLLLPRTVQIVVVSILGLALALNAVCWSPNTVFLHLDISPDTLEQYVPSLDDGDFGFVHTLQTIKDAGLMFLYVIVVAWSLVWPPTKLVLVGLLLGIRLRRSTRRTVLAVLGQLGRLSLFDVYFAVFFQLITADQSHMVNLVGLVPLVKLSITVAIRPGLLLFHLAIGASIVAVSVLEHMDRDHTLPLSGPAGTSGSAAQPVAEVTERGMVGGTAAEKEEAATLVERWLDVDGWRLRVAVAVPSAAALVLCVLSFSLQLFTVGDVAENVSVGLAEVFFGDLLLHNSWSLGKGVAHFYWASGSAYDVIFGLDLLIFTLFTPVACTALLLLSALLPAAPQQRQCYRYARELSSWSNLEVLFLTIVLYKSQEASMISIILGPAFWCALLYVCCILLAFPLAHRLVGGRQ